MPWPPKKGVEYIFYTGLRSQATSQLQANPTLAAGDFKVATDDAAPANLGTLPVVDADFTKRVKVTVSASEMNGDNITIIASDQAGAEWFDAEWNIQTSVRSIDDLAFPTTSGRSIDVTATGGVGIDWANVENPTSTVGLTNTTISTTQVIATATSLASAERNAIADAYLDRTDAVETGLTPRGQMRIVAAAECGVLSGAGTSTMLMRNAVANSKTRLTATVDGTGNRTAVGTDVT